MSDENEDLNSLLQSVGAILTDSHFVYQSGKHGSAYVNWAKVNRNPRALKAVAAAMTELPPMGFWKALVGPTHTGDKLATALMLAFLEKGVEVYTLYAQEKTEKVRAVVDETDRELEVVADGRIFPRGQLEGLEGAGVFVVDDVLTTGGTIGKLVDACRQAGLRVEGILIGCNRSDIERVFDGIPVWSLFTIKMEQYDPDKCPLCVKRVPINTDVGHGESFLSEFGEDPANWPANKKS